MITKLRSSLLLNKFSSSAPEENVDNSMKNMPVADPDLELREEGSWFFAGFSSFYDSFFFYPK